MFSLSKLAESAGDPNLFQRAWAAVQANSLQVIFGFVGAFLLILLVASIIVVFFSKRVFVPTYSKEDFFHKVLKHDTDVRHQLLTLCFLGLGIAALVCFLVAANSWVTLGLAIGTILSWGGKIALDIKVKFNRIEYNPRGLYQHRLFGGAKAIEWQDLKQVLNSGQTGQNRALKFVSKQNRKIIVPMKMMGAYEFTVWLAETKEGKNFEAVKIMQARY